MKGGQSEPCANLSSGRERAPGTQESLKGSMDGDVRCPAQGRAGAGVAVHPLAVSPCTSSLWRARESTRNFPGAISWARTPGRPGDGALTVSFSTRHPRGCTASPAPGRTSKAHPRPRTLDRFGRVNCEANAFCCFASRCLFAWLCLRGWTRWHGLLSSEGLQNRPSRSRISARPQRPREHAARRQQLWAQPQGTASPARRAAAMGQFFSE